MRNKKNDETNLLWLQEEVQGLLKLLPKQEPLFRFVHYNPLDPMLNKGFSAAMKTYASWYGSREVLLLDEYRNLYANGRYVPEVLLKVAAKIPELASLDSRLIAFLLNVRFVDHAVNPDFLAKRMRRKVPFAERIDRVLEGRRRESCFEEEDSAETIARRSIHSWEQYVGFPIVSQANFYWQRSISHLIDRGTAFTHIENISGGLLTLINDALPTRNKLLPQQFDKPTLHFLQSLSHDDTVTVGKEDQSIRSGFNVLHIVKAHIVKAHIVKA